jgi:hypothetical protein
MIPAGPQSDGLLTRRVLLSAGLAAAFCHTGLGVFSVLFFSQSIISDEKSYGPAVVVMILLSYMIAFGVVAPPGPWSAASGSNVTPPRRRTRLRRPNRSDRTHPCPCRTAQTARAASAPS